MIKFIYYATYLSYTSVMNDVKPAYESSCIRQTTNKVQRKKYIRIYHVSITLADLDLDY